MIPETVMRELRYIEVATARKMRTLRVGPFTSRLRGQGFDFYDWGPGEARLVTSWDSDPAHIDALAAAIRAL